MSAALPNTQKSADAFRSIGEAASELELPTHVLRYWEGKFPQIVRPIKRPDGRRMFRPEDVAALRAVKMLVHEHGLTLKGAKTLIADQGVGAVLNGHARLGPTTLPPKNCEAQQDIGLNGPCGARELQDTVRSAFSPASTPDLGVEPVQRLESVLVEITDLKRRLDAARDRKAA